MVGAVRPSSPQARRSYPSLSSHEAFEGTFGTYKGRGLILLRAITAVAPRDDLYWSVSSASAQRKQRTADPAIRLTSPVPLSAFDGMRVCAQKYNMALALE